ISTTDVSASRLENEGDPVGGVCCCRMSFTSCFTSRPTVPCSPIRGVTVSTMPTSLYSTVWVPTIPVELVVVVLTAPPIGICWEVSTGTDFETLMTAFLFSLVITDGLDSTLTLFSVANRLMADRNSFVAKVKKFSPVKTGLGTGPRKPGFAIGGGG